MIKRQRGVTLIELMISMMLGLGLVAGISQLFIQSQKSFSLQRNISDMTDDGAFLLEVLAKGVLLAGYSQDGTKNFPAATNTVFAIPGSPTVTNISFSDNNEYIHGLDDDDKGDQFVYRYTLSDVSELTNSVCTDMSTLKAAYVTGGTVTVRMYKKYDNNSKTFVFYCKAKVETEIEDAQPLVSHVEKLVFKYGIRVKIDPKKPENDQFYYADATTVTTDNLWKSVFAVKIFIVLRSADENLTRTATKYKIEGVEQTPQEPTKKRLYKTFSKTIYLRASEQ